MPRMRMTIEFDAPDSVPGYRDTETAVTYIIADALGEFVGQRRDAREYVSARYDWLESEAFNKKIASVEARNSLARNMGMTHLNDERPRVFKIERID
jgi:hypothetical protein